MCIFGWAWELQHHVLQKLQQQNNLHLATHNAWLRTQWKHRFEIFILCHAASIWMRPKVHGTGCRRASSVRFLRTVFPHATCVLVSRFPEGLNLYCKQRSCYDVLGLEELATGPQIKKAYRKMSLKYHPDKSNADDAQAVFMVIATAYEVLSDEKMRKTYNDFLAHPERHVWEHYGHFYGAYYAPKSDLRSHFSLSLSLSLSLFLSIFLALALSADEWAQKARMTEGGKDRLVIMGILVALSTLQYTIFTTRRKQLTQVILAQNKSQV